MIRSLRRAHRLVWLFLALALPALFVAALLVRRALPLQELPPELDPGAAVSDDVGDAQASGGVAR